MTLHTNLYVYKRAESAAEFEQIHAINYATFVREIPQHRDSGEGRLVDKFHDRNLYFIALRGDKVVGMLAVNDQPPFSIASRLPDPSILTVRGLRPLEVRLLAVLPEERGGVVFAGLACSVLQHVRSSGHTHLFISGFENRLPLYEGLGFQALGAAVGPEGSRFVPMCLTVSRMKELHARTSGRWFARRERLTGDATP